MPYSLLLKQFFSSLKSSQPENSAASVATRTSWYCIDLCIIHSELKIAKWTGVICEERWGMHFIDEWPKCRNRFGFRQKLFNISIISNLVFLNTSFNAKSSCKLMCEKFQCLPDKWSKVVFGSAFRPSVWSSEPMSVCVWAACRVVGRHFLLSPRSINLELARCHGRLARTLTFHSIRKRDN